MPKYDRQLHALLKERNKLQAMTNTPRQAPAPTKPKMDVEKEVVGLRRIAMNKGLSRTISDTKVAPLPEYKPGVGPLVNKLKMKALQPLANAQQGLRAIAQMPQRILSGKPAPTASSFIGPKLNPSIPTKAPTPTAIPTPTPTPMPQPVTTPAPQAADYSRILPEHFHNAPKSTWYPTTEKKYGPPKAIPQDLFDATRQASERTGIPQEILLGLAWKESGMQNIAQYAEDGLTPLGRGYFQFDMGQRPDITEEQALDPYWASNRVADEISARLNSNNIYTGKPNTLWEAIVAHNVGEGGVYSDAISPYYGIPLREVAKNYGASYFEFLKDRDWLAQ